ncbi:MAG: hypothetical protein Q9190_006921 [Brigantiaea leucoxantha]
MIYAIQSNKNIKKASTRKLKRSKKAGKHFKSSPVLARITINEYATPSAAIIRQAFQESIDKAKFSHGVYDVDIGENGEITVGNLVFEGGSS